MKSLSYDEIKNIKQETLDYAKHHHEMVVGIARYIGHSSKEPISFQEYYENELVEVAFHRGMQTAQKLFEEQKLLQEQQQKVSFSQRFLQYFCFA